MDEKQESAIIVILYKYRGVRFMAQKDLEEQAVRKTFKGELQKLKDMTLSQKAEYIYSYYRIHILIIVLVVLAAVYGVYTATHRQDTAFQGVFLNYTLSDTTIDETEASLSTYFALSSDYTTILESGLYVGEEATDYTGVMKLTAYISAKELDMIIGNTSAVQYVMGMEGWDDLSTLLPAELYTQVESRIAHIEPIVYEDSTSDNSSQSADGNWVLDITDSIFVQNLGLSTENPIYLGFVTNSQHQDNNIAFMQYILDLGFTDQ